MNVGVVCSLSVVALLFALGIESREIRFSAREKHDVQGDRRFHDFTLLSSHLTRRTTDQKFLPDIVQVRVDCSDFNGL